MVLLLSSSSRFMSGYVLRSLLAYMTPHVLTVEERRSPNYLSPHNLGSGGLSCASMSVRINAEECLATIKASRLAPLLRATCPCVFIRTESDSTPALTSIKRQT